MYSIPTLVNILLLLTSLAFAQTNVTVPDTDTSISYLGGAGDASLCSISPNGTITSKPGCYLVPSNCAPSVAMGQSKDSQASFSFKGSAIYINSLRSILSPLYTVTLDGTAVDVDGYLNSTPFVCDGLFARTGLDPTIEHTITLSIKGVSPSTPPGPAAQQGLFDFSLINFIYTTDDSVSNGSTSTTTSSATGVSTGSVTPTTSSMTQSSSGRNQVEITFYRFTTTVSSLVTMAILLSVQY